MLSPVTSFNGFSIEKPTIIDRKDASEEARKFLARCNVNIDDINTIKDRNHHPDYCVQDGSYAKPSINNNENFKDNNLSKK